MLRRGRSASRGSRTARSRSRSRSLSRGRRRSPARGRSPTRRFSRSPSRFGRRTPRRNITRHFRRRYPYRRFRPRYYHGYRRRPTYYYGSVAYAPYYYASPYYAYYYSDPHQYAQGADYTAPHDVNQVHVGTARDPNVWLSQPNTAIYQRDQQTDPVFLYCERGRPVLAEPGSGTTRRPLLPVDGMYYQCSAN